MKNPNRSTSSKHVVEVLRQCLAEGKVVDIDGLGRFQPVGKNGYELVACRKPRVFLAYVQEDGKEVGHLYQAFRAQGFDAWLDRKKLLPGQNWPRSIEDAIENSDFFVACFSQLSVRKKGGFQAEIRYALDCAKRVPLDETFLIPVRLNECRVPARIRCEIQYIDLFPDWDKGIKKIITVMERQLRRRGWTAVLSTGKTRRLLPLAS